MGSPRRHRFRLDRRSYDGRGRAFALDKDREDTRLVLNRGHAASVGRAKPVPANQFHAESVRARMSLTERPCAYPNLEQGKICQLVREPHLALCISQHLLAKELVAHVSLVIPGNHSQMHATQRPAVLAVNDANGDRI